MYFKFRAMINDRDSSVAVLEAQTVLGAAADGHDSALLHIDVEAIQNGPVLQLEQSFLGILFAVANDGRVVGVQKSADRAQGLRGASQASDDFSATWNRDSIGKEHGDQVINVDIEENGTERATLTDPSRNRE